MNRDKRLFPMVSGTHPKLLQVSKEDFIAILDLIGSIFFLIAAILYFVPGLPAPPPEEAKLPF